MSKKKLTTRIKESSWKTTLAGILTLAATGAQAYGAVSGDAVASSVPWTQVAAMIGQALVGGGLIVAKDAGK
ncbi:hypothetical protein KI809_15630 [Geobacter pelophilus]|uniref:Holin n=1 Tax=Geoanaerobacter pelophilus TaxID=60036 RepID=A0AAW4LAX6_9BACT|nr:hypothetical protein [Geoanaerobacter pelophilus]MBT0665740.1 hypothetical protein [Geoanaerobacter pelophilus]